MKVKKRNMQRLPRRHWGNLEKRRFASPIQLQLPDDLIHFMAFSWQSSWLKATLPSRNTHGVWPLQELHPGQSEAKTWRQGGIPRTSSTQFFLTSDDPHFGSGHRWQKRFERVLKLGRSHALAWMSSKRPWRRSTITRCCKIARCCEITRGKL